MTYDHTKTFENIRKTVAKVNKDTMKMLVSLPEFQKLVKELRQEYNIPPLGLNDEESTSKWYLALYRSVDYFNNWKKTTESLWLNCKNLRHDSRYIENIRHYVKFNIITAPFCNVQITQVRKNPIENLDRNDYIVKVYHKLTGDEITYMNHCLQNLMSQSDPASQKKLKPKPELERDLEVIEKTKKLGEIVMDHEGAYEYRYNDIVSEVYEEDADKNNTFYSDKKRKESLRKSKRRTEKDIKERLGWDTTS